MAGKKNIKKNDMNIPMMQDRDSSIKEIQQITINGREKLKAALNSTRDTLLSKIPVISELYAIWAGYGSNINEKKLGIFNDEILKAYKNQQIEIDHIMGFLQGSKGNAFFSIFMQKVLFEGDFEKIKLFSKLYLHIVNEGEIEALYDEKMIFLGTAARLSFSEFQMLFQINKFPWVKTDTVWFGIPILREAVEPFAKTIGKSNEELWKLKSMFQALINEGLVSPEHKKTIKGESVWRFVYTVKGKKFLEHLQINA